MTYWWVLGIIVLLFLLRMAWQAYSHPAHVLGRQAANMNWIAIGNSKDKDGNLNVCYSRNEIKAIVSFVDENVQLLGYSENKIFKDFIELERYLATDSSEGAENNAVAMCLDEIVSIRNEINNLSFCEIESSLTELVKDEERTNYSINEEGMLPKTLVYLLITNVIQGILPTGNYHVYRGALNGKGQGILEIWDYSTDQLARLSFHSDVQSQEDKKWIREQIKNVG